MSCYSQYRGKSIGRMNHYIQEYCGIRYAEEVEYDGRQITFGGRIFATVEWKHTEYWGVQVPWFYFCGEFQSFEAGQRSNRETVMAEDIARELNGLLANARKLLERVLKGVEPGDMDMFKTMLIKKDVQDFLNGKE